MWQVTRNRYADGNGTEREASAMAGKGRALMIHTYSVGLAEDGEKASGSQGR